MPTLADLQPIVAAFRARHDEYRGIMAGLPLAPADVADNDTLSSIVAEGTFIRYFTLWEATIENSFIHFCQGGPTLSGMTPICRLANCDASTVRKILTGRQRYLDWSDQTLVRERAKLFFQDGIPFYDPIIGNSHVLADAEKIRNVIAHDSIESWNAYKEVQRNNFQTERTFPLTPGQLLRVRQHGQLTNWGEMYFDQFFQTLDAILNAH